MVKQFLCPACKKDLKEVGIKNVQSGWAIYDATISGKDELEYEFDEFETDNRINDFYCEDCGTILDLETLGINP